jgi:FAD synthase
VRFDSVEALVEQIQRDVEQARELLRAGHSPRTGG